MKERPAYLPLYVRDFLTDPDVLVMRWLDQALYLRMLMASWERGPLPEATNDIRRLVDGDRLQAGLDAFGDEFDIADAIKGVLDTCWEHCPGIGWTNRRLEHERARWQAGSSARSERARGAANKRWADARSNAQAMLGDANPQAQAQAQDKNQESRASGAPSSGGDSPTRKSRPKKPRWQGELPASLRVPAFEAAWTLWLRFRDEELRKPVTQLSGDQALSELSLLGPVRSAAAIHHTIAKGWQGIREPEPPRNGHGHGAGHDAQLEYDRQKTLKELGLA